MNAPVIRLAQEVIAQVASIRNALQVICPVLDKAPRGPDRADAIESVKIVLLVLDRLLEIANEQLSQRKDS